MSFQRRILAEIENQGWTDLRIIDWDVIYRLADADLQEGPVAIVEPAPGVGHVEIFPWRLPGEVLLTHDKSGEKVWTELPGKTVIPVRPSLP